MAIIEATTFTLAWEETILLLSAVDIGVDVCGLVVISCLADVYRVVICVECREEDAAVK